MTSHGTQNVTARHDLCSHPLAVAGSLGVKRTPFEGGKVIYGYGFEVERKGEDVVLVYGLNCLAEGTS